MGHGLNAQELARNPRLDYFFVKDLNEDQKLEFQDKYFDAVLCSVGVQYLQQPEKVPNIKIICICTYVYFLNRTCVLMLRRCLRKCIEC